MGKSLTKLIATLGAFAAISNPLISEKAHAENKTVYISWTQGAMADSFPTQAAENFGRWYLLGSPRAEDVCGETICATSFPGTITPDSTYQFRMAGALDSGYTTEFTEPFSPSYSQTGSAFVAINETSEFTNSPTFFCEGFILNTSNEEVKINEDSQPLDARGYFSKDVPLNYDTNTITIEATNLDGTLSITTRKTIYDIAGPELTVNPIPELITTPLENNQIEISGTVQDNYSVKEIHCGYSPLNSGYSSLNISTISPEIINWDKLVPLNPGLNTLNFYATDMAWNSGGIITMQTFYDSLPPTSWIEPSTYLSDIYDTYNTYIKDGIRVIYTGDANHVLPIHAQDSSLISKLTLEKTTEGEVYNIVDLLPLGESSDGKSYLIQYQDQWNPGENNFNINAEDEYGHAGSISYALIVDDDEPFLNYYNVKLNDSLDLANLEFSASDNYGISHMTINCGDYDRTIFYNYDHSQEVIAETSYFPIQPGLNECTAKIYDISSNFIAEEIIIDNPKLPSTDTDNDGDVDGLDIARTARTIEGSPNSILLENIARDFGMH